MGRVHTKFDSRSARGTDSQSARIRDSHLLSIAIKKRRLSGLPFSAFYWPDFVQYIYIHRHPDIVSLTGVFSSSLRWKRIFLSWFCVHLIIRAKWNLESPAHACDFPGISVRPNLRTKLCLNRGLMDPYRPPYAVGWSDYADYKISIAVTVRFFDRIKESLLHSLWEFYRTGFTIAFAIRDLYRARYPLAWSQWVAPCSVA